MTSTLTAGLSYRRRGFQRPHGRPNSQQWWLCAACEIPGDVEAWGREYLLIDELVTTQTIGDLAIYRKWIADPDGTEVAAEWAPKRKTTLLMPVRNLRSSITRRGMERISSARVAHMPTATTTANRSLISSGEIGTAENPTKKPVPVVPRAGSSSTVPAAVSGSHRHLRPPTIAFQIFDPVGLRTSTHETQSLHLRYGPPIALPTLSSCRYLHKPKARSSVGRLHPLPRREFHPLDAPRFAWRAEVGGDVQL